MPEKWLDRAGVTITGSTGREVSNNHDVMSLEVTHDEIDEMDYATDFATQSIRPFIVSSVVLLHRQWPPGKTKLSIFTCDGYVTSSDRPLHICFK